MHLDPLASLSSLSASVSPSCFCLDWKATALRRMSSISLALALAKVETVLTPALNKERALEELSKEIWIRSQSSRWTPKCNRSWNWARSSSKQVQPVGGGG